MRELLIRYLLGELEPYEHDAVQQQLAESPELRRELARLRTCFSASLADDAPDGPPRGLAERTAVRVSESGEHELPPKDDGRCRISDADDPPAGVLGWSLADLTVAGGVILAVSMLLFPAIRDSRDGTRRNFCQNNLHEIGRLMLAYGANNGGYLPEVQPGENAGIFTVRLVENGFISDAELERLLVCPGSSFANLVRANQASAVVPSAEQLHAMSDEQLAAVRPLMSPTYAYCLGFRVGNQYHYVRSGYRTPILCDAPSGDADRMSDNHRGAIVQVLYADGSVGVLRSSKLRGGADDLFANDEGKVAAGLGRQDHVLGASDATPGVFFINADQSRERLYWRQPDSRPRSGDTLFVD